MGRGPEEGWGGGGGWGSGKTAALQQKDEGTCDDCDVCQTVMSYRSLRPYILIAMGKSERSAVPKHTKVSRVTCFHHVAVGTIPFTNIAYIILWIARCLT